MCPSGHVVMVVFLENIFVIIYIPAVVWKTMLHDQGLKRMVAMFQFP